MYQQRAMNQCSRSTTISALSRKWLTTTTIAKQLKYTYPHISKPNFTSSNKVYSSISPSPVSLQLRNLSSTIPKFDLFSPLDTFPRRHNGSSETEIKSMLDTVGVKSMDDLVSKTVPANVKSENLLNLQQKGLSETQLLEYLKSIASKNKIYKSYIGMGYTDVIVPPVILRNILESPGWYTQVSKQILFFCYYLPHGPEKELSSERSDFLSFRIGPLNKII